MMNETTHLFFWVMGRIVRINDADRWLLLLVLLLVFCLSHFRRFLTPFFIIILCIHPLPSPSSPPYHSLYTLSCLLFAYAEGYKGFHLKFAPLVVKRSFTLLIGTPQGNNPIHYILAPPYSMGLMYATKKRLITSWSVTLGVAAIVGIVKRLSPIPRCIIDAGVIVGLSLGTISILYHYIRSIVTGQLPNVDACLPDVSVKATSSTTPSKKGKND